MLLRNPLSNLERPALVSAIAEQRLRLFHAIDRFVDQVGQPFDLDDFLF